MQKGDGIKCMGQGAMESAKSAAGSASEKASDAVESIKSNFKN